MGRERENKNILCYYVIYYYYIIIIYKFSLFPFSNQEEKLNNQLEFYIIHSYLKEEMLILLQKNFLLIIISKMKYPGKNVEKKLFSLDKIAKEDIERLILL